jgi:hypothetical protein
MANLPIRVRLGNESKRKIVSSVVGTNNLTELYDVSISGLGTNTDNYVLVYNNQVGKFTIVDPDVILSAASTSTGPRPGLPLDFLSAVDSSLDNKIDVDAGFF